MSPNRIQILPPHVVNRIAAGEVVERPASVIKELVENALDAGASKIEIFATAGGRTLRVADNGSGMTSEDARLAFYNHATSKINEESDLSRIQTLGFRGEALASIASISRLVCYTRTAEASMGTKVTFTDLGEPLLSEVGCAPGTVMEVSDLFFNTPARLKFLKRPQTELNHLEEVVQYLALSHPETQFSLKVNDKTVLKTRGSGNLKNTLEEVFRLNRKEIEDLLPVTQEDPSNGLTLAGYMSPPGLMKSSKRWMVTFVNERSVRCGVLAKAIESAYASLIPSEKYPLCVLFLSVAAEDVDVNVHPTKKEVRYASPNGIFGFIRHSLQSTLEHHGHQAYQAAILETAAPFNHSPQPTQLHHFTHPLHLSGRPSDTGFSPMSPGLPRSGLESRAALNFYAPSPGEAFPSSPETPAEGNSERNMASWRVIGQLFNTYLLLETRQGLMVVDQHIASERTFFEALTRNTFGTEPDIQHLMAVTAMEVTPNQAELLRENHESFAKLGFTYTLSEETTLNLTGVPIIYQGRQPKGLFESLLSQLEETGQMQLKLDDLIATLSCHSAVRAGDSLTPDEMHKVIERWLACTLPWTCPHGRPIAHTIQTSELNHFFHRPSLPVNA